MAQVSCSYHRLDWQDQIKMTRSSESSLRKRKKKKKGPILACLNCGLWENLLKMANPQREDLERSRTLEGRRQLSGNLCQDEISMLPYGLLKDNERSFSFVGVIYNWVCGGGRPWHPTWAPSHYFILELEGCGHPWGSCSEVVPGTSILGNI